MIILDLGGLEDLIPFQEKIPLSIVILGQNKDTKDPEFTDRIMVVSSYDGQPPLGRDGYTNYTTRQENTVKDIKLNFDVDAENITVNSAILQMFVDDFQAPVWGANYKVHLNGKRAPFLEKVINSLNQTGPIGKLISVQIPPDYLDAIQSGKLTISIDDKETGAGDGYAIDFVRLLINPKEYSQTGTIVGKIVDSQGDPVQGASVFISGSNAVLTDSKGNYKAENIPSGRTVIKVMKQGFVSKTIEQDLTTNNEITVNVSLKARSNVLAK